MLPGPGGGDEYDGEDKGWAEERLVVECCVADGGAVEEGGKGFVGEGSHPGSSGVGSIRSCRGLVYGGCWSLVVESSRNHEQHV